MQTIEHLNQIDASTKEGQYLLATLAMLTTTTHANKVPDEVLKEVGQLRDKMFPEIDMQEAPNVQV